MQDPNSTEAAFDAAQTANHQELNQGTDQKDTVNPNAEAEPQIDYQKKFSESSKEALRLLEEKRELERQLDESRAQGNPTSENLYPGFDDLDEVSRNNLIEYTNTVENRVKDQIYKDPAISFARQSYNESKWDKAFKQISSQYPDLKDSENEFKSKYFQPNNNVPDNIDNILGDVAKIYLFDKAKDMGAQEEKQRSNRIDMERSNGGDKTPPSNRSLDDWERMAQENPVKFAQMSKQYQADAEAGKLKE